MGIITTGRLAEKSDIFDLQAQQQRIVDEFNGRVSFGDPQNPKDPTSQTILAGDYSSAREDNRNGFIANMEGAWVEVSLTATITDKTCTHNLYLGEPTYTSGTTQAVPVSGEPNCRWMIMGIMHDGTNKDGTTTAGVDVVFMGGTVSVNAISLRFIVRSGGTALTVGSSNPVQVSLFFIRATRGE